MSSEEGSLRDDFAMAALSGILAQQTERFPLHGTEDELLNVAERLAKAAYVIADAMQAEANRYMG